MVNVRGGDRIPLDEPRVSPMFASAPLPAAGPTRTERSSETVSPQEQRRLQEEGRQGAEPPLQQQLQRQKEPLGAVPPHQQQQRLRRQEEYPGAAPSLPHRLQRY